MKILVVYYSLDGNTKLIAEAVAEAAQADTMELVLKNKKIKAGSFMKYFWGGRQVMMKEKPELEPLEKDPADYDIIFIGTPVWAWNFTPAISSFISSTKISDKKIALFCCHGGGMKNTFDNLAEALADNQIIGKIDFKEPLKNGPQECVKMVKDWTVKIISN